MASSDGKGVIDDETRYEVYSQLFSNVSLKDDNLNQIMKAVTPFRLKHSRNPLLNAMGVSKELRDRSGENEPNEEEFRKFANSVESFASALLDPLMSSTHWTWRAFQAVGDALVDKAIECEQKKLLSHSVIFHMSESKWYGGLLDDMRKEWNMKVKLLWILLHAWLIIEMVLFPFVFVILMIFSLFHQALEDEKEIQVLFVFDVKRTRAFQLMKDAALMVITQKRLKHCRFSLLDASSSGSESMPLTIQGPLSKEDLAQRVRKTSIVTDETRLDLDQAMVAAENHFCDIRNLVLVIFTDATFPGDDRMRRNSNPHNYRYFWNVLPVMMNIWEHPSSAVYPFSDHRMIDWSPDPAVLGRRIADDIKEGDSCIAERYLKYFRIPYFIFVRDTVSYFALLGLHVVICLSPSSLVFTGVEWAILAFFLGRLVMEMKQFRRKWKSTFVDSLCDSWDGRCETIRVDIKLGHITPGKLAQYFSDRWNVLDFATLLSYITLFVLRMITWGVSSEVTHNTSLAVSSYMYGLNCGLLTLRVFGHMLEAFRGTGAKQIALFYIIGEVWAIFLQFFAAILGFSIAITKIYIAERSLIGWNNVNSKALCRDDAISCWWMVMTHLSFSILGIADLESFNSVDDLSVWLAKFLYGLFLIFAVIVLVNMLIALLSSTYQHVEDNSLLEWGYKRAITIRTYSNYHCIPVPLNLISMVILPIYSLWKRCWCWLRKSSEGENYEEIVDEDDREDKASLYAASFLMEILSSLEAKYFDTHGNTFPLTEEDKINKILQETDGICGVVKQIAQYSSGHVYQNELKDHIRHVITEQEIKQNQLLETRHNQLLAIIKEQQVKQNELLEKVEMQGVTLTKLAQSLTTEEKV